MRKVFQLSVLFLFLLSFGYTSAQKLKFGHTDSQAIMTILPDTKEAQKALEEESKKMEEHLANMRAEAQKKYNEYLENDALLKTSPEKWSDLERADKEAELQSLQDRLTKYQQSASDILTKKQNELYQPILEKIKNAINEIAKEGDFIYIFDINALLYYSETQSIDVTPLIKKKLGITN